jgi:transposase
MRVARPVVLDKQERGALEQLARGRSLPARLVERARIVLRAAGGLQDQQIASELGIMPEKAARWRNRYLDGGIPALEKDASRPGRPRTVTEDRTAEVIHKTTQEKPFNATHWSTRSMAAATGLSEATIRRIWHANGLKPHLVKSFKVSNDVQFAEKLDAIVGLYLNPPEHAIVLCADVKSQIQALDRTQPGLPIKKGRCGTMTHDYKRNGTATLFAALDALDGTVISMCDDRHRHQEWLKFLRVIDQVAPPKGTASDRRQLCHAQASEGAAMAHSSSPVPYPLHHAHQQFGAEHGGALLPGSHAESATARRLS